MERESKLNLRSYFSQENLRSAISWWIILNLGIIAYYSHDFGFLAELRFVFAEFLVFVMIVWGLKDVNFILLTDKKKLTSVIMVLGIATILHFQFEHSFEYFFFGDEL
ncbi:MAG: hypothetical protein IH840_02855 [Candidatus Heimdallarchaeota archaeon]|nr:hypothetical protein [Candidatus Heimdallarchaeota archaeon]